MNQTLFPYLPRVLGVGSGLPSSPCLPRAAPCATPRSAVGSAHPCRASDDFPVLPQPPGSQLAPLQPPLGSLSPLRGLSPSSSIVLRGPLSLESVADSNLDPKEGTLVRLPLPWEAQCKGSQAWGHFNDSICALLSVLKHCCVLKNSISFLFLGSPVLN